MRFGQTLVTCCGCRQHEWSKLCRGPAWLSCVTDISVDDQTVSLASYHLELWVELAVCAFG